MPRQVRKAEGLRLGLKDLLNSSCPFNLKPQTIQLAESRHGGGGFFFWYLGWLVFSPTAESFGVSAQIGSGVVRGDREVRFHEGSTRVPPEFHLVLRGLRGGPGLFEVRFHEGSLRGLRGGPGGLR